MVLRLRGENRGKKIIRHIYLPFSKSPKPSTTQKPPSSIDRPENVPRNSPTDFARDGVPYKQTSSFELRVDDDDAPHGASGVHKPEEPDVFEVARPVADAGTPCHTHPQP